MRQLGKAIAFCSLAVFAASCAPTYRSEFDKLSKNKGWTTEQRKAALEYSYRYFGKEDEDGKYAVLYSRLPKKEVVRQLDMFVADLDGLLSYKDEETDKYLKAHGLRPHFEHQEEVFKAIQARVRVAQLHDVFEELLGKRSYYSSGRDEFGYDHAGGYSASILALDLEELKAKFPFKNQVLEEAKEQGLLKEISRYTLAQNLEMASKQPDPDFPEDPNKFVWRKRSYQMEVVTYKVMDPNNGQPRDNNPSYAEVYRLVEGVREATPAVRAFMDRGSYAVAVIDVHQTGKIGNGLPDAVESLSVADLSSSGMIARIFPDDSKTQRVEPKLPPIRVEIKPIGTEIDLWEVSKDKDGWKVPFTYQGKDGDNYTVSLRFKQPKKGEPLPEGPAARLKQVEYIEKRWTPARPGAGEVVEYFVPREPFNKPVLAARVVTAYDMPVKLEFVFPDGTEETIIVVPGPNKAHKDRPEAIGYNWLDKRYLIKDFDDNGTYEKRREVGELTSSYSSYGARMDDFGGNGGHHDEPALKPEDENPENPKKQ